MTAYVFTGPTLSAETARRHFDAVYLPPASQGDVYRVALRKPWAIGIIDGYFETVPSVWHKEILWAMGQGIHVYGSASMGALRAAELEAFGMEGVGAIFEAYRDGEIEDDDEVAVIHGPAELDYPVACDAMVNIRSTLRLAVESSVIGRDTKILLERVAKEFFYPERIFESILQRAAEFDLPREELETLSNWLPANQVDQKRDDAIEMLKTMGQHRAADTGPKSVSYFFQHTDMWDHLRRHAGRLDVDQVNLGATIFTESLLDEMRLEPEAVRVQETSLARALALNEASRQGLVVDANMLEDTIDEFRRERELWEPEDLEKWLGEQDLVQEEFVELMKEEARIRWVKSLANKETMEQNLSQLRLTKKYSKLLGRARAKQLALRSHGLENPSLSDTGLTEDELLNWYFKRKMSTGEIIQHAKSVGFENAADFRRAIIKEYCFVVRTDRAVSGTDRTGERG